MSDSAMTPDSLRAAGWKPIESGGFNQAAGPFWMRTDPVEVGLIVEPRHCNSHVGTVHGGVLMTFADIALGCALTQHMGHSGCFTVSLQTQFVTVARVGEFIRCQAEIVRAGNSMVFLRGLLQVGDRVVATADGVWKLIKQEPC